MLFIFGFVHQNTDTMIENFEEITEPLNVDDLKFLPVLIRGLQRHGKDDPIKGRDIVKAMNRQKLKYNFNAQFSEARLRKLVNHMRVNSLLAVMATSNGYFVSDETGIINSQIRSLRDRAAGIMAAANGLESFIKQNELVSLQ